MNVEVEVQGTFLVHIAHDTSGVDDQLTVVGLDMGATEGHAACGAVEPHAHIEGQREISQHRGEGLGDILEIGAHADGVGIVVEGLVVFLVRQHNVALRDVELRGDLLEGDVGEVDMLAADQDLARHVVDIEAGDGVAETALGKGEADSVLIGTEDVDADIGHHIHVACIEGATMGLVGVLTQLMVVGLEMQALDVDVPLVAPEAIDGLFQEIVLAVVSDVNLLGDGMLKIDLEGRAALLLFLLLIFLLVLFRSIEEELVVGRAVIGFIQQGVDAFYPQFLHLDTSLQQREESEVTPDLLHEEQLAPVLVFQPDALDAGALT